MSHFFAVVLVPKDTQDIEAKVEELLEPYSEHISVDEYDRECWCINSEARKAGFEAAEKAKGPIENIRKTFWNDVNNELSLMGITLSSPNYWDEQEKVSAKLNWEARIKEFSDCEKQAIEAHPMFNKPTADCDDCKGTGTYKSTYNPASKWDWWVIGGRWDGVIQNNYRSSENGFNFGAQHHQLQHNLIPVNEYLNICRKDNGQYPYSIITPIGQWCEKGKMGWFGITHGEKSDWKETADKILDQYKDCIAIGVDCHI